MYNPNYLPEISSVRTSIAHKRKLVTSVDQHKKLTNCDSLSLNFNIRNTNGGASLLVETVSRWLADNLTVMALTHRSSLHKVTSKRL